MTENSVKSLVTSGSKSSTTEVDTDNLWAGCGASAQTQVILTESSDMDKLQAASASTQVITDVEMEEMLGDSSPPPSKSIDDDFA